jgi:GLPGLI family protein
MKFLFVSLIQFYVLLTIAQPITSGKIVYKETIKLSIDLGEGNEEMAKLIPNSQSHDKVLYFNTNETLYKNYDKAQDLEINKEEDGNSFQLVMKVPESELYINAAAETYVHYQDLMGKEFLIVDRPTKQTWKITGEQKSILNYNCQKAILKDSTKKVEVWFTSLIPSKQGPAGMNGLPGMILAIEQDNGERMTIATSIESLPKDFVFAKPLKGKKVTKAEFEKIRDDKMKEMGAINGKGTGVKMIIREEKN